MNKPPSLFDLLYERADADRCTTFPSGRATGDLLSVSKDIRGGLTEKEKLTLIDYWGKKYLSLDEVDEHIAFAEGEEFEILYRLQRQKLDEQKKPWWRK